MNCGVGVSAAAAVQLGFALEGLEMDAQKVQAFPMHVAQLLEHSVHQEDYYSKWFKGMLSACHVGYVCICKGVFMCIVNCCVS